MIKHAIEWTGNGHRYVCNHAVGLPTAGKVAIEAEDLTCKNCIDSMKKIKCLQCGKHLSTSIKGGKWCSMDCKSSFYKENFCMSFATRIHIEQENERTRFRRTPGHRKFMKRAAKIGFCAALQELGEFKPAPEDWNDP